jgi:hypothetical protein
MSIDFSFEDFVEKEDGELYQNIKSVEVNNLVGTLKQIEKFKDTNTNDLYNQEQTQYLFKELEEYAVQNSTTELPDNV